MRVLIAPDKFKHSLTSQQVCDAVAQGLRKSLPNAKCISFPLADGGEGTSDILTLHSVGYKKTISVHDPLQRVIRASYGLSADGKRAFIEMANASGLWLLPHDERHVMQATTTGTGELIRDALDAGAEHIVLGIGGSATNDAAIGAASALGYKFLDEKGSQVEPTGENLIRVKQIQTDDVHPALHRVSFTAMCDVDNPLYGEHGAAYVYAPQKGATPDQVKQLDQGLQNIADVFSQYLHTDIRQLPGAGAGGGFGGGAVAFFKATLRRGVDVVFDLTHFEEALKQADVIITGEGKLDEQTLYGKVVAGVSALARRYDKKLVAIAGRNELTPEQQNRLGLSYVAALDSFADEATLFSHAADHVYAIAATRIAEEIARVYRD